MKIYYKLCWDHCIADWFITKKQIISINKKTRISVSRNKKKFKKKSILIYFDYEKSAIIDANASEHAMRAHLQQIDNQEWKQLITCYTQKLTLMKQ